LKKTIVNNRVYKLTCLFLTLIIVSGSIIIYDNFKLDKTEYTIESNTLPKAFNGFKIIHISDLHNTEFGEDNEKLLKIIKEQKPDAVFVTGDTIDGFSTNIQIPIELFKEILKICDVYFVVGNHESRVNINIYTEFIDTLTEIGVIVLKDSCALIEKGEEKIQVIGLNDASEYKADYNSDYTVKITETINNLDDESFFSILLSHHPELFPEYKNTDIDLVFSGHAHGGQFRLPFIGGIIAPEQGLFPEFDAGVFNENNTTMIVSCGLGNSIVPVRINNSPEVVVVALKNK
jgi:predicted MPP superfamily phosphohydrolase